MYVIVFPYLYTMTNKEIIELLKEQIQASNKREAELLARINELTQEIASLKEALLKKGESLGRQQRIAKGLAKLVSCQSEKQDMPAGIISDDERERKEREARERADLVYYQANGVLTEATAKVDGIAADITDMADQVMAQLTQLQVAVSSSKQALQDAASIMNIIRPNK